MSDPIFYAAAEDQKTHKITGFVPSKFLMRNGAYVVDPVPGASQLANLYSDNSGSNPTDGKIANPNNYVVVPANYSEQQARDFAARLGAAQRIAGLDTTLEMMTSAFWPGGTEELQRNPRWGIPPNSFVRAFTSGASDHFGYVTGAAGLARGLAEAGGGLHNLYSWASGRLGDLFGPTGTSHPIDISGASGLSKVNQSNIAHGYAAGVAANNPPIPYNDYGYGATPGPTSSQLGAGNGTSSFGPAVLAGIDPNEVAPPTWPPGQAKPIRYLGSSLRH